MKIDKIILNNFRQYNGETSINLSTIDNKNIVLIGGLNGYGKTNLLISFVWCLFGENIEKTDTRFRNSVKRSGNYPKFLKENLNFQAKSNGIKDYSVEIHFSDVDLPSKNEAHKCIVKRSVNTKNLSDNLEIKIPSDSNIEPDNDELKVNFVNDFIVPLDAAKFIFFNAEKISDMADLSIHEEGELLNDALSNILGLDVYEELVRDFERYIDQLKKSGSKGETKSQIEINEAEEGIKQKENERIEEKIAEKEEEKSSLKLKVIEYQNFINLNSGSSKNKVNIGNLYEEQSRVINEIDSAKEKLNELIEIVPFAILSPLMEETIDHIKAQVSIENEGGNELKNTIEEIMEKLFNKPEFPPESDDLTLKGKLFYSEKALSIASDILKGDDEFEDEVTAIHDLTQADKNLLFDTYSLIRNNTSIELVELSNRISERYDRLAEIEKTIKSFESEIEREEIIEYRDKKQAAEESIEKIDKNIGKLESRVEANEDSIVLLKKQRKQLLAQIELSKKIKKKIELASKYLSVLTEFIVDEKKKKSKDIADHILTDMQTLMHKNIGDEQFITKVKVNPLPDNDGLNINLFNNKGDRINKEFLSEGEKQIYISSVIKALINEADQSFPIVIDTPLARLDQKHKNQVLKEYYPSLGEQVILMATDSEIPLQRKKMIDEFISRSYRLENRNNNTVVAEGYFGQ